MDDYYFDELCDQELVNEVFNPIKDNHPDLKRDIEEIEFLFKNCNYNLNSMIKFMDWIRDNQIVVNPKAEKSFRELSNFEGSEFFKIENITIYQDIILFEFYGFLINFIRTINFLVKFNLTNKENLTFEDNETIPTIGILLSQNNEQRYRDTFYYNVFKENYDSWIKVINDHRNNITHKWVVKLMGGSFSLKKDFTREMIFSIPNQNIENMVGYCRENRGKLRELIKDYFSSY